jgi:hypothetical protein
MPALLLLRLARWILLQLKSSTQPARGSVYRTARVSIASWDSEESGGSRWQEATLGNRKSIEAAQ